jgi:hypothetical protein
VELANNSDSRQQIDAFKLAFEAQRYTSPAHLRALAIQQLTEHSLNPDWPPAQRVKCLELIGKMTEVVCSPRDGRLSKSPTRPRSRPAHGYLRTITQAQAQDVDDTAADSLLAELAGPAIEPERRSRPELVELELVEPGPADVLSEGRGTPPTPRTPANFWIPP